MTVEGTAILGSGEDLRVLLLTRGGGQVLTELNPDSGNFNRRLDETSKLALRGTTTGANCCEEWENVHPWATEIYVERDGRDAWVGPVTHVEWEFGAVTVEAADLTAWWDRRVLPDFCHDQVDLSDIFLDYHNAAMAPDPSPNISLSATRTGVLGSRAVFEDDYDYASDHIKELTRSGLDFTAFGRTIIVGGEEVPANPIVTLLDEHWTTPPKLVDRGNDMATEVVIRGNSEDQRAKIRATATSDSAYTDFYGLLVRVFNEAEIRDFNSAQHSADTHLDLLQEPLHIVPPSGAGLRPTAPITLPELVPGARVRVQTEATCKKVIRDFRLFEVRVDFAGGVSITLQPLGTFTDTPNTEQAEANGSNCVELPDQEVPDQEVPGPDA